MKKSYKYIFSILFVFGIFVGSLYAASTGPKLDPGWQPGVTARGSTYSLASNYATATGNNTGVYFSELGYLESHYAKGDRAFPLYLYEEDYVNADDKVKTYEVYFKYDYTNIAYIQLETVNIPGNIEAVGDNVAELYLSGKMQKLSGDPSTRTNLFYYDIHLN